MKFRFYITDLNDGSIRGTNKEDVAFSLATSEDIFVVDSETGTWIQLDGDVEGVRELPPSLNSVEEEEEEEESQPDSDDIDHE